MVNIMEAAGLYLEHLDLTDTMDGALDREQLAKLLTSINIKSVGINLTTGWGDQESLLQGLMSGRCLENIMIKGCEKEIAFLPTNIKSLEVYLEGDVYALGWIMSNENIRRVRQTGGVIPSSFWKYIAQRSSPLESLELDDVDIWMNTTTQMTEAMARINHAKFNRLTLMGKKLSQADVTRIINRDIEKYIEK